MKHAEVKQSYKISKTEYGCNFIIFPCSGIDMPAVFAFCSYMYSIIRWPCSLTAHNTQHSHARHNSVAQPRNKQRQRMRGSGTRAKTLRRWTISLRRTQSQRGGENGGSVNELEREQGGKRGWLLNGESLRDQAEWRCIWLDGNLKRDRQR